MIGIDQLSVKFGGVTALDAVTAQVTAGIAGLVGPNGAGKTTMLNVLSGFQTPTQGTITLNGIRLDMLSPRRRAQLGLRRLFQQEQVVGSLTVAQNILAVFDHLGSGAAAPQIDRALALTGMQAVASMPGHLLNLFQRRMTEIAKATIGQPKLILMDEPGAGLDANESAILRNVILRLPAETGAQIIIIDHDTQLIADLCKETMVLDFGRLIAFGPTRDVLDDPAVREAYLGVEHA